MHVGAIAGGSTVAGRTARTPGEVVTMRTSRILALVAALVWVTAAPAGAAFVGGEMPIHTLRGSPRTSFGWAVSELTDIDADGVMDLVVGAQAGSVVHVFSGRTGERLHLLSAPSGAAQLGYAVADAGDVDGDGVHDVVAGAPTGGPLGQGVALVFSGADGTILRSYAGDLPNAFTGAAVGPAGDVNGDGFADVLVGSPRWLADTGVVDVVSGADGSLLRRYTGELPLDWFGSATAAAGDLDGDGVTDHVIGAKDAGLGERGRVSTFSGATGEPLWTVDADLTGRDLGLFFVAGVGDVDADGTPDVYGADFVDLAGGPNAGRASVYSGTDGSLLHTFTGASRAGLGPGRGAGDLDGDGHADLVVGSYTSSSGSPGAGRVDVFSGADGSVLRSLVSASSQEQLGFDAVGIGDVDGDGVGDLLVSAANDDTVYVVAGLS